MIEVSLTAILSIMFACATVFFTAFGIWVYIKDDMLGFVTFVWSMAGLFIIPQFFIWGWIVITI